MSAEPQNCSCGGDEALGIPHLCCITTCPVCNRGSLADDPQAVTYAQVKAADFGHPMTEGQITAVLVAAELGARLAAEGEQ